MHDSRGRAGHGSFPRWAGPVEIFLSLFPVVLYEAQLFIFYIHIYFTSSDLLFYVGTVSALQFSGSVTSHKSQLEVGVCIPENQQTTTKISCFIFYFCRSSIYIYIRGAQRISHLKRGEDIRAICDRSPAAAAVAARVLLEPCQSGTSDDGAPALLSL